MPRSYTDRTLKLLWGRSGGRCAMPECRTELIADSAEYDPMVVIGEIAHVAAASDGGPRAAPEMGFEERNSYGNLILLCQNCHARIDGQQHSYSVERLKEIKAAHEAWVRASLPERGRSRTGWMTLCLLGDHAVDFGTAAAALTPDFIAGEPMLVQVPSETADWRAVDTALAGQAQRLLAEGDSFDRRLAIFPLAPVSACIALGYHLTNRPHVRLFQYHRDERTWVWPRQGSPAQDLAVSGLDAANPHCRSVSFLFHLSAEITDTALTGLGDVLEKRVEFRVSQPSTAWLQHPDQIKWLAFEARSAFEQAVRLCPNATVWHLFFAGPAPGAVAVGQQMNPTMCPQVQLYEYRHREEPPYKASIRLGDRNGCQ
jgi:hypothetical protein